MTDRLLNRFSLLGAVALGLCLGACAQDTFVEEGADERAAYDDGNAAKAILISLGAIEDPRAPTVPKFQPRPALVVPPKRDLPSPIDQDAALADKKFPVDPEIRDRQERDARLKAAGETSNGTLTLDQQAKFKDLPVAGTNPVGSQNDRNPDRTLKPWELDGKAQADALAKAQSAPGPASKQQALLTPPEDYRTPSSKAPLESPPTGLAAMKPSWWPF